VSRELVSGRELDPLTSRLPTHNNMHVGRHSDDRRSHDTPGLCSQDVTIGLRGGHPAPAWWVTARMMHMPSRLRARRLSRTGVDLTDAAPVQMKTVLDVVEASLQDSQLEKLFVVSDEPHFLEQCHARFDSAVFAIPLQAVATPSGTPAHFTDVVGEIKASEALEMMLVLSRAKVLVKTESLLSDWATTLSDDQRVIVVRHSAERGEAAAQISRFGQRLS
jgi:hypothetical protein